VNGSVCIYFTLKSNYVYIFRSILSIEIRIEEQTVFKQFKINKYLFNAFYENLENL